MNYKMDMTKITNNILRGVIEALGKEPVEIHPDELVVALTTGISATVNRLIDDHEIARLMHAFIGKNLSHMSANKEVFEKARELTKFNPEKSAQND